jgi:DNA polymerase-3 subunit gamma/tau
MSFLATARKWRPMVFEDIVGQEHVAATLRNAIASNRLAHAYIFSGPRGVGKTTAARILAKAVNCLHPKDFNPDNTCELCSEITENRSVNVFEIDGASNRGVEEIRNLREAVRYSPPKGKYRIYIIDEVHMLTREAFNALLKTLEEPPSYVIFIFATTEVHKVPLTILSRCQRFDFRRIATDRIVERLRYVAGQEGITIDENALFILAKRGDGSLRDAHSIFDQVVSFCGTTIAAQDIINMLNIVDDELYFEATDLLRTKDVKGVLQFVERLINSGVDVREFLSGLMEHFRNILVTRTTGSTALLESSEASKKRYRDAAAAFSETDLLRLIKLAVDTESAIRWGQQPRLRLEVGLITMARMDSSVEIQELLTRLQELKKKVNGSTGKPAPPPSGTEAVETPVTGSVKATPPTLRPEQIVQPPVPPPPAAVAPLRRFRSLTALARQHAAPASLPEAVPPAPILSADEAVGKWPSLIEAVQKERVALGAMLSRTHVLKVTEGRLQIACPDDFHLDTLRRNRDFLDALARRVYGAKVLLETIVADVPEAAPVASPPPSPEASRDLRDHAVVRALKEQFGAVEVE